MGLKYLKNVSSLKLDAELCNGCEMCINVCPHNVLAIADRKVHIENKDSCMECSACVKNCPQEALSVNPGVGCAYAILVGMIKGTAPNCDC